LKSIKEINWNLLLDKKFHPSPERWEDQVLYFLLVDRFSDGNENSYINNEGNIQESGSTSPYNSENDYESDKSQDRDDYGLKWNGGNLPALTNKLGYLKRMGITTIWISPVLKQVAFEETYHGYGTQNFMDVDPHIGKPEDLKQLVSAAHQMGMYVILDIIVNHSGDVFAYRKNEPKWRKIFPYRMKGFKDKNGTPVISVSKPEKDKSVWPDGAVWPVELQRPKTFTRRGRIVNWDNYPEYIEGDFFRLKNIYLGKKRGQQFKPSEALKTLTEVYKYWIAFADLDGFRLDTTKHMWPGAVKYFTDEIHHFTESIGKQNFYIIGEITGGRSFAMDIKRKTNLDAALGINDIPESFENGVKGYGDFKYYFDLFENDRGAADNKGLWFRDQVVTMFDDHDMVSQGEERKARFCADKETSFLVLNAIFANVFTLGIACLYYGTEQGFDGAGPHDKYIREAMFGGRFGAFRSRDRHFFKEEGMHAEIAEFLSLRKKEPALRIGSQFYRKISTDGKQFGYPAPSEGKRYDGILAWSRFCEGHEVVLVLNSHSTEKRKAHIQVDYELHQPGDVFECLYMSYDKDYQLHYEVVDLNYKCIELEVPAAGCAIFKRIAKSN